MGHRRVRKKHQSQLIPHWKTVQSIFMLPFQIYSSMFLVSFFLFLLTVSPNTVVCTTVTNVQSATNIDEPGPIPVYLAHPNQTLLDLMDNKTDSINLAALLIANNDPTDNCDGSHYCSWSPALPGHHRPTRLMCEVAYEKYDPNSYYERYVSRYEGASPLTRLFDSFDSLDPLSNTFRTGSCTAIVDCWPPVPLSGYEVQKQFDRIRNHGCERCGTHYFVRLKSSIQTLCERKTTGSSTDCNWQ